MSDKSSPRREFKRRQKAIFKAGLDQIGDPLPLRVCVTCHGLIPERDPGVHVEGGEQCSTHADGGRFYEFSRQED